MTGAELERTGPPAGADRLYDVLVYGFLVAFICAVLMVPVTLGLAAATLVGYATGGNAWTGAQAFLVYLVAAYMCGLRMDARATRWANKQTETEPAP